MEPTDGTGDEQVGHTPATELVLVPAVLGVAERMLAENRPLALGHPGRITQPQPRGRPGAVS